MLGHFSWKYMPHLSDPPGSSLCQYVLCVERFMEGGEAMKRIFLVLTIALVMAAMMVVMGAPAFADSQPQSGQPGLTEGQNGPPPYPNGDGGGQPQAGQPGLTEGQNGPPPYP
jgi:hypothetical protein